MDFAHLLEAGAALGLGLWGAIKRRQAKLAAEAKAEAIKAKRALEARMALELQDAMEEMLQESTKWFNENLAKLKVGPGAALLTSIGEAHGAAIRQGLDNALQAAKVRILPAPDVLPKGTPPEGI